MALGESRYHAPNGLGKSLPEALDAFERAIELDPGFGPAYEHVLEVALRTGREDRAAYHARAAAELRTVAAYSASVRLEGRLLLLPEARRPEALAAELDSVPAEVLYEAGMVFLWVPDAHETAVQLLRRLARRQVRPGAAVEWVVDPLMRTRYVAAALIRRGHLREALSLDHADLTAERPSARFTALASPKAAATSAACAGQAVRPADLTPRGPAYTSGPVPMKCTRVASGVRLSNCVSLTRAVPFWPVSKVSASRSFGRMPSTLRDTNSPLQVCRPGVRSVMVTCTSTFVRSFRFERSIRAVYAAIVRPAFWLCERGVRRRLITRLLEWYSNGLNRALGERHSPAAVIRIGLTSCASAAGHHASARTNLRFR
jgi:hypothetical protein